MAEPERGTSVHGTAIAVAGRGILIRGPSGAGKSDLALRCLAVPVGAFVSEPPRLVADDQVMLEPSGLEIRMRAPATLANLIEVRGIGILTMPAVAEARLTLVVDLVEAAAIERMPLADTRTKLLGRFVPLVRIAAHEPSAPLKVLLALAGKP